MARVGMNASVSLARAMLVLSSCLIFGTLIGLSPHSGGQNLRSKGGQQQQQNPTGGGSGILRPKLPDLSLFSRPVSPAKEEAGSRALGQADNFVWDGEYAFGAVQEQTLDAVDSSMDVSFSFAFEGSYSYDY